MLITHGSDRVNVEGVAIHVNQEEKLTYRFRTLLKVSKNEIR